MPNELLTQIFEDVYTNWLKGLRDWSRYKPLTRPLSKRLVNFQRQQLYRDIKIRRWTGAGSFATVVNSVFRNPQIGPFVISLRFEISTSPWSMPTDDGTESELSTTNVNTFFGQLTNLRHLTLAGRKNASGLTAFVDSRLTFLVFSFVLARGDIDSVQEVWHNGKGLAVPNPQPDTTPPTKLSQIYIQTHDTDHNFYGDRRGVHLVGLVKFGICSLSHSISTSPIASSLLSTLPAPAQGTPTKPSPPLNRNLEAVEFRDYTFGTVRPLLPLLLQFPIETFTLRIHHDNFAFSSPFLNIASTVDGIRKIKLEYTGERGEIGTRVSTVDFDGAFRGIDLDTEDVAEDAMPDDWTYSNLSTSFPVDELINLRDQAIEAEIEIDGGNLYHAIEVQQAADDDVKLLNELWQKWKKKTKKSGKGRKSK